MPDIDQGHGDQHEDEREAEERVRARPVDRDHRGAQDRRGQRGGHQVRRPGPRVTGEQRRAAGQPVGDDRERPPGSRAEHGGEPRGHRCAQLVHHR